MVCLPVGILLTAAITYYCAIKLMSRKLSNMTDAQKTAKEKEALHALFVLTDADHSGAIDPGELADILCSLGWSIKLAAAQALAHALSDEVGAHTDEYGQFIIGEDQFIDAIVSGTMARELQRLKIKNNSNKLMDSEQLVKWTLKSNIVSNSLSGATQLLLLAHTPVSRKVFLYFHCHEIDGRYLLRADYDINCTSDEYFSFVPFVLLVLVGFIVALPTVILVYLWVHRNDLYTARTHQRIGWLCKCVFWGGIKLMHQTYICLCLVFLCFSFDVLDEPFVRGAEFWQVHDLLMK
jgi:hypothetical protein